MKEYLAETNNLAKYKPGLTKKLNTKLDSWLKSEEAITQGRRTRIPYSASTSISFRSFTTIQALSGSNEENSPLTPTNLIPQLSAAR